MEITINFLISIGINKYSARGGRTLAKEKTVDEPKNKIDVKIEIPIHPFGFFTFNELGSTQEEDTKIESPQIYVFPKSTAAITQT